MRLGLAILTITLLLIAGWWAFLRPAPEQAADLAPGAVLVSVTLPDTFTATEQIGATAFAAKCADCHGVNGAGRDGVAPPLIHKIYEPSHHGDASFHAAVMNGVRAHHWTFGNMPPVDGLTHTDIDAIVAYVRTLQRTNGIN